jgi:hypothetical protein
MAIDVMAALSKLPVVLFLSACGTTAAPPQAPAPAAPPSAAAPGATLPPPSSPREVPALAAELSAEGVSGTIALLDTTDGVVRCSDAAACQASAIPASTFKIPNSMIALETGIVEGPDTILPWDGQNYSVEAWNQDLSLRDALRVSCVPCYQALARQVGEQRMREWVERLDYGNRDIAGGIDRFWLTGALRITPLEQIDFLRRLDENKLPISVAVRMPPVPSSDNFSIATRSDSSGFSPTCPRIALAGRTRCRMTATCRRFEPRMARHS